MNKNTQGKPSGKPVRRDGVDPVLRSRARRRAVQAIYAWQISGGNAQSLIAQFAHEQAREIADLAYFEALLHGVLDNRRDIDEALGPYRTVASRKWTRSSARCCAWPATSCVIAWTCRTAW